MRAGAIVLALLAGCRAEEVSQADNSVVCSLDGRAFYARPGVGDVTFLGRLPSADGLCAKCRDPR